MRPLGAHLSAAGGPSRAVAAGVAIGCTTVQLFLRAPGRWAAGDLAGVEVARFRAAVDRLGGPAFAHAPYLLNLASADEQLRQRSLATLVEELGRAETLGIAGVVLHPGSAGGGERPGGEARCRDALAAALAQSRTRTTRILLEVTAGAGGQLGRTPAELARLVPAGLGRHFGVCLDTAHLWGGGVDLLGPGWRAVLDELRGEWGRGSLRLIHANDTAVERGSHRDRHAPPGEGALGETFFRRMLAEESLAAVPVVVEIPPGERNATARRVVARLRRWQAS